MAYRGRCRTRAGSAATTTTPKGVLLWLDVDTRLRELTRDRRSLDDFARAFFGTRDGELGPLTYTFDDVVGALDAVAPHDWAGLLRERLDGHGPARRSTASRAPAGDVRLQG